MEQQEGRTSVAVIGAGAIGGYFAAHLVGRPSVDVTCCVRTPFDRLVVEKADGTVLDVGPSVCTDPSTMAVVDVALVGVKAHQTDGARAWLEAVVGPDTLVVALQNGVEHEDRLRPHVGQAAVLPAVVYCGVEATAPGHIVHSSNGFFVLADSDPGSRVAALFEGSGAPVRLRPDLRTAMWEKLCANIAANGIMALTDRRSEVFGEPAVADLARRCMAETIEVGTAEGAVLDDGLADVIVGALAGPPDRGASMLFDRRAGRPLETDALYGAVQRAGRRHGIATPTVDTLAALLGAWG